ncbi:MAG: ATPase, T2SS/T4P/T4SS family [Planctomycetota bacterium]|nr:ATPase, T2SS/T4P/T4SS family [Planctomycetota bacterium]
MAHHLAIAAATTFLMSPYKPILFGIVLAFWARAAGQIDQDLADNHLKQKLWNTVHLAAAFVAFGLWLVIPYFWLGLPVAMLILAGTLVVYILYRNPKVHETQRWTLASIGSFAKGFAGDRVARHDAKAQKHQAVRLFGPDGKPGHAPEPDSPQADAQAAMEEMFVFAAERHAQRIELLVEPTQTAVNILVDGVKYAQKNLEAKLGLGVVDFLKANAGMDVADRRKRQTGNLHIEIPPHPKRVVPLVTSGSTRGVNLTVIFDRGPEKVTPLDDLGLLEVQKQCLIKGLDAQNRVVIVSAPSMQGLTTTLYSLISRHDPYTSSVVSLEEDSPFDLEGVKHTKVDASLDAAAFNQKLKSMVLQDPQVLYLGKIPDPQTVKQVVDSAANIRFYVGLRQEDTFAALKGWIKAVGDPKAAADSLTVIVAQRLVRRLCMHCRLAYKPDPEVLRKLNLTASKVTTLYKQSGQVLVKDKAEPCPQCMGLGFRGRLPVFEVMVLDDEARALVAAGQFEQLRASLRKQKMLWMQEAALARAVEGVTTVNEILRAMSKEEAPKPKEKA